VIACIGAAELARRQFHEIARIAGLVFASYLGSDKSLRGMQASAGLIYDVLAPVRPSSRLTQASTR
jgi:ATP-dependent Lhr-like helicase